MSSKSENWDPSDLSLILVTSPLLYSTPEDLLQNCPPLRSSLHTHLPFTSICDVMSETTSLQGQMSCLTTTELTLEGRSWCVLCVTGTTYSVTTWQSMLIHTWQPRRSQAGRRRWASWTESPWQRGPGASSNPCRSLAEAPCGIHHLQASSKASSGMESMFLSTNKHGLWFFF